MRIRLYTIAVAALALSTGCTAVNAQIHIEKAESSMARAKERGADAGAEYEWTLAERFLAKAQEEIRQNHFGVAEELADAAAGYADQSIIALESAGRDLQIDESSLDTLPDRIGTDLIDRVDVQIDYVDLPQDQIPTSADDVITDEEVEALFGRGALDAMHGEGQELQGPNSPDRAPPVPGSNPANDEIVDPMAPIVPDPTPEPGDLVPDPSAPDPVPTPPAPSPDGEWQDLTPGDDDL